MQPLNLSKGQSLELKKADGSSISKIRAGLSWDVAAGVAMDLDLFVVQKGVTTLFYGNKNSNPINGILLSDDNRTGAGDGDDEFVTMDGTQTVDGEYFIGVSIYDAVAKAQTFASVNNAKVTVYNNEDNTVLATYSITENGGANTALIVGKVQDSGNSYTFTALGNFLTGDINAVSASV